MTRHARAGPDATDAADAAYLTAFLAYVAAPGEEALTCAYDFGRAAMEAGRPLPELVALHHRSVAAALETAGDAGAVAVLEAAAAFLAEALSPYEMAQRGVRDAVLALRRWNQALEAEIRRVSRTVHDEAGQLLTAVHLALAELRKDLPPTAAGRLAPLQQGLADVEARLRNVAHELRPTLLEDLGVLPAIRALAETVARRFELGVGVDGDVSERLPPAVETVIYRVVHEALTNVGHHARARHAIVAVFRAADGINVAVEDDGVGFRERRRANQAQPRGLGLVGMRERLDALGGRLQVESTPGRGTRVHAFVPLEPRRGVAHRTR